MELRHEPFVPAKAGTQGPIIRTFPSLGPRFRGDERSLWLDSLTLL
jgi:hypothetical protein